MQQKDIGVIETGTESNLRSPYTSNDTIVAVATPPGRGSVGIVRLSGTRALSIAQVITKKKLTPRHAHYLPFYTSQQDPVETAKAALADKQIIDEGIVLYFKAPHSFTGEDIVEFQAHGGPVVLQQLIETASNLGARLARPGEFTERAFHNDKLDLAQAEAVADLINAQTRIAARRAQANLSGEFSATVDDLATKTLELRMYIESAIDFPEEEIDFLSDQALHKGMKELHCALSKTLAKAETGRRLQQGLKVALSGAPNAGKSSLLNALTEKDSAIVTSVAGTTRDTLHEHISLSGIPLELIDTAGLRNTQDLVEQAGIDRAYKAVQQADIILWVVDATRLNKDALLNIESWHPNNTEHLLLDNESLISRRLLVVNKLDLLDNATQQLLQDKEVSHSLAKLGTVFCSAANSLNLASLTKAILKSIQADENVEDAYLARTRHTTALKTALAHVKRAQLELQNGAGEIAAEECRMAHEALFSLTGKITQDDLLGEIFSSFCIGK